RGDIRAEERMKRINEAFRVLGRADLRADYDARSGARLPELEILPAEVVLRAFDSSAHEINFSVRLSQVGGPPFDPSIHRIDLTLAPPWHLADVHWHWSRDSLPADVDFTLAFGGAVLGPAATLSGAIARTVTARSTATGAWRRPSAPAPSGSNLCFADCRAIPAEATRGNRPSRPCRQLSPSPVTGQMR